MILPDQMPDCCLNKWEIAEKRIGTGEHPAAVERASQSWPGIRFSFVTADIRRPTDWAISRDRHTLIVHLGGRMDVLETELDGHGGSSGPANPGEVWTVPAGRKYASYAKGDHIAFASLEFENNRLQGGPVLDLRSLAGLYDELTFTIVRKITRRLRDRDQLDAECLVRELCDRFASRFSKSQSVPVTRAIPDLSPEQARIVREYILDNIANKFTLANLAHLLGLTTHHLLIVFRRAFGITPAQFVNIQRVRAAQRMLLHSSNDITSIALAAGFSSHSHMTSVFTRRLGCPPSEFRRRHKW